MAACSDTEEKPSSPKETLPLKIHVENAVNHEMRKNCYNELSNISKNYETFPELAEKSNPRDVSTLSEDEFLELMIEASTFNKSSNQESDLLKKLRKDNPVTDTEPSDKVKLIRNCTSQFSLHRNSKNYVGTSSSLACSSSQLRTSDGRKKHSRNRDDSSSKNVLNANVLQKGIHQSQSLQDLMSSDLSKSKQKSHKAHRTHSLSSDEVLGIDSDSLVPLKNSKKSGKASSNSSAKLEASNKTSFSKGSSKSPHNLGSVSITLDMDDENEPCISEDSLPHLSAVSANCRKEQNSETASADSPIEIEMEEIKSDKASSKDDCSLVSTNTPKSENRLTQSNSKFYVDCNDIDTTVTFPLKLVSSIEDKNNNNNNDEAISEQQLRHFPLVPWPRPLQVQSFFSSLQMDSDYNARNEKSPVLGDANGGNPFTRNSRPSNLASLVSSTLMDYNNGSLGAENKNRKNKRLRNSVNKGVLSENIAGHRGEEDIDSLLQFINSSDKKGKTAAKGNTQNHILSTKNFLQENEKKKPFGKELKSCKNIMHTDKKKLTRSNSLENMTTTKLTNVTDVFAFETRASAIDSSLKDSNTVDFENSAHKNLDINSNEERYESSEKSKDSSTDDSSLHNSMGRCSPETSSFVTDFYSTADVSSQTVEEAGFLVVKKKQRKKHPSKRSDAYRWRNAQAQRKKGMMLPLAESKCGKHDSRRKSTSSVPHSEHSSADNSDLDSVHSLPVRGSVPHPTQPHPHTTPSSSSSTPQASYADIARMPISKLNSPSPCITYSAQTTVSQVSGEQETKKTDSSAAVTVGKRRASDCAPLNKDLPQAASVETDSDSFPSDVKVRSHAKSTREINTQTEPESSALVDPSKVEHSSGRSGKKVDDALKTVCSVCSSSRKNTCSCPKPHVCARQKVKSLDIPPVIMDNMPSESNPCNVSFGFGIEEVLDMVPASSATLSSDLRQKDNLESSDTGEKLDLKDEEKKEKCEGISEISSVNKTASASADSSCKSSSSSDVISKTVHNQDLSLEQSSHLKTVSYGTGKNICYSETKVNTKKFNLSEVANFLGTEFQSIEKEIEGNKKNKASSKGMYYVDSSEEA